MAYIDVATSATQSGTWRIPNCGKAKHGICRKPAIFSDTWHIKLKSNLRVQVFTAIPVGQTIAKRYWYLVLKQIPPGNQNAIRRWPPVGKNLQTGHHFTSLATKLTPIITSSGTLTRTRH